MNELNDPAFIAKAADHMGVEPDWLAEQNARMVRAGEITSRLLADNPRLPNLTAIIMGNDMAGAERVDRELRAGNLTFDQALPQCGSFSRLDWAVRWQEAGFTTRDHLLDIFPGEWPSADPDDTDPRFRDVFIEAWSRNGGKPVTDRPGTRLPSGKTLRVYRGQPPGAPIGLSWSLDPAIAERFAKGAWARTPVPDGEIVTFDANRRSVLAYLTGRNESEVILDPRLIERV